MPNIPNQEDINSGQAVYTTKSLPLYDLIVTKFSNRFAWNCPRQILIDFFKANISNNHLDVGVGTGYFLQRLNLIPSQQRLGLLDLNKNCLAYTAEKLNAFAPEVYQYDVFEPFTSIVNKFDSVSLNYILHCLPGTLSQKAVAFDHIKAVLNPGGTFFGSTLLGKGVNKNWLANKLMTVYNKNKIFANLNDDSEVLLSELQKRFANVRMEMRGCVALFVAKNG